MQQDYVLGLLPFMDQCSDHGDLNREARLVDGKAEANRKVILASAGIAQSDCILPFLKVGAARWPQDYGLV